MEVAEVAETHESELFGVHMWSYGGMSEGEMSLTDNASRCEVCFPCT